MNLISGMSPRVAYHTLGCKLNFAETSAIGKAMADRGFVRAAEGETPHICVVNTCSVTEMADKKGRQLIRRLHRRWPRATIVRWLSDHRKLTDVLPAKEIREFAPSCEKGDRTRWWLKVQDGCDCWCTYCTIPMARGRSRSGSIPELVEQARQATSARAPLTDS